jgi:hypothetical protein
MMKIFAQPLTPNKVTTYTHRVNVYDTNLSEERMVTEWMNERNIPHTKPGFGVFYLNEKHVSLFLLRWS